MAKGLDYSWARPGGAAIKAAGFQFVVRYIPYPGSGGKGLEAPELADLRANGLAVAIVYESFANRALQGHDAGVADAQESQRQIERIGLDNDMPVYFAVDFDAAESQQGAIDDYLRGAASVLGANRIGVYAGYWIVKRCHENGTAAYLWQTYAWSGGNVHPDIHLYQYLNGQNVNGSVDFNENKKADFGQENSAPLPPAPTPAPQPSGQTYTVVKGDTLIGIGAKTGTDWHRIADLNHISAPYTIYPGQVLQISGGGAPAPQPAPSNHTYTVVKGDTLSGIGGKLGIDWHQIANVNGLHDPYTIYPNQVLVLPGGSAAPVSGGKYQIKSGDTFWGLEASHGWVHGTLQRLNPGVEPTKLQVGQTINTP